VTPALTWMMNLNDGSYSLTPELLYTGITNLELRRRIGFIIGTRNTEFGEKRTTTGSNLEWDITFESNANS
jgi:hypothetical protein